jgi:hypothetical protein
MKIIKWLILPRSWEEGVGILLIGTGAAFMQLAGAKERERELESEVWKAAEQETYLKTTPEPGFEIKTDGTIEPTDPV